MFKKILLTTTSSLFIALLGSITSPSYGFGLKLKPSGKVPTTVGAIVTFSAFADTRDLTSDVSVVSFDVYSDFSELYPLFNFNTNPNFTIPKNIAIGQPEVFLTNFQFVVQPGLVDDGNDDVQIINGVFQSSFSIIANNISSNTANVVPVPEPLTILGSAAALGASGLLSKEYSKIKKKKKKKEGAE